MEFAAWLENDEYEQFRAQIERSAEGRQFPFAAWFAGSADGRIFVPFGGEGSKGADADVVDELRDNGFRVLDYRNGLAQAADGRQFKIGRVLNMLREKDRRSLESRRGDMSPFKFAQVMRDRESYWKEVLDTFQNSPYRANKNAATFEIAFSYNIHDIGAMSTGRQWTSCMNLVNGVNKQHVYKEVKDGGFVAYLIRAGDHEIKRPLARIHIRRFVDKKGRSIAIPEDTVYGNEVAGFPEAVRAWLDSKQGRIPPGSYYRRGGCHSDTFAGYHIQAPDDEKRLTKMLEFGLSNGTNNVRRRPYVEAVIDKVMSGGNYSRGFLEKIKQIIINSYGFANKFLFAMKYPEIVDKDFYDRLTEHEKDRFDVKDPRFREYRVASGRQAIEGNLDIDNPNLDLGTHAVLSYTTFDAIEKLLEKATSVGHGEGLIRQIVKFANDVIARFGPPVREQPGSREGPSQGYFVGLILNQVVHTLNMMHADTPTAVNFYQSMLPYFDLFSLSNIGSAIARLGANGRPFLPFLRDKLEELESDPGDPKDFDHVRDHKLRAVERMRYIIDSIENGSGRSDRYAFY